MKMFVRGSQTSTPTFVCVFGAFWMVSTVQAGLENIVLYNPELHTNDQTGYNTNGFGSDLETNDFNTNDFKSKPMKNAQHYKNDVIGGMITGSHVRRQGESTGAQEYNRMTDKLLCRAKEKVDTWLRHPANCSRHFICSGGQVREMKPCDKGQVFSIRLKECVKSGSPQDDCHEMVYSLPVHRLRVTANSTRNTGIQVQASEESLVWHPQFSQKRDATPALQLEPTPLEMDDMRSSSYAKILELGCSGKAGGVFPHPDNCAWYYNCSLQPDAVMKKYYGSHVMECPYPQLFSLRSHQCEDFEDVDCRGRYEPKSPCDYRANHCHETSHCIPCWVRYASCLGLEDGLNPWPELEWKPFFVECYQQRTVFQGSCDKSAVFSPLTRACETPYSIPREHGGWRPSCQGRRDGKYPDEYGRCESYYTCSGEMFTGFHSCPGDTIFDPITESCQLPSKVPYPCGDLDSPNFCHNKSDGNYLDAYGRCTHYYSCVNGEVDGVSMCPEGVFDPESKMCVISSDVTSPCGTAPNPCLHRPDGYHIKDEKSCREYYLCERGLQVASFACDENTVFNGITERCDDVADTAPPCGLAPTCAHRPDGRYPALNKGVQYYYTCVNFTFSGYFKCSHYDGGLAFSRKRRQCDSPSTVCSEMYGSSNLC